MITSRVNKVLIKVAHSNHLVESTATTACDEHNVHDKAVITFSVAQLITSLSIVLCKAIFSTITMAAYCGKQLCEICHCSTYERI